MADATFQFELVSPEKLLLSKTVASVTVPGGEGEYGVLAGHAPMITTLQPGVIAVMATEQGEAERIFVSGGFAEVSPTRCTVLATEAVPVGELKKHDLEAFARDLADKLSSASEGEMATLQTQQAIVAAKLNAAA